LEEARLCKSLGSDLVITDHHECKDVLPLAVAILDPHRPDGGYPHLNLSGVGVAFKLACALHGSQQAILDAYGDMLCLGTIADVMLLRGENRLFVERGLKILANTRRPGLAALMEQSGCDCHNLTASSVGYVLAPRINAAGRMGKIELAIDLFLTDDPEKAKETARQLCDLNKARQGVEADIYRQAVEMLPPGEPPQTIVLADESWHQGVVGIVASRMAEEYCCPTFLICLDGEHGKASSRSYGGFNLFAALKESAGLLESYGGHELAAGFTVQRQNIPAFREKITELARKYYADSIQQIVLDTDCVVTPELLTLSNVDSLSVLEPCGNGCPKPLLVMEGVQVEKISQVGSGKHMRLQLRKGNHTLQAIYFSATARSASIAVGDVVDVAFAPQINEFRGIRSVQLNLQDIRPHCTAPCKWELECYTALKEGTMTCAQAQTLTPDRATLGLVWRYLSSRQELIREEPMCLCRKIVRWSQKPLDLQTLLICLDIFADVGLLRLERLHKHLQISLCPDAPKADLTTSATMAKLLSLKES
jgi:single-stranded-DNA-specific exonuclease